MPLYGYKCPTHGEFDSLKRGDEHPCPECGGESTRVFAFRTAEVLGAHYNPIFGQVVNDRNHAKELAKHASQRQSEQLGMDVNYVVTDAHDHEAVGVDKAEAEHVRGETIKHAEKAARGAMA